ncbi:MAG TPA: HNH endonuclease [Tissierellaceae bacterium]
MYIFKEIEDSNKNNKHFKEKYKDIFNDFGCYLKEKKLSKDKNANTKKGMCVEYPRFIRYSMIIHFEKYGTNFEGMRMREISRLLLELKSEKGFKEIDSNNFYNSSINEFYKFSLNPITKNTFSGDYFEEKENYLSKPVGKVRESIVEYYPRNLYESLKAKIDFEWKCEINPEHISFTDSLGRNFVEGHHLIPMSAQKYYTYSIDFSDNIVSLCPNCHRMIHFANDETKIQIISELFEARKEKYRSKDIEIDLKELLAFYNIEE